MKKFYSILSFALAAATIGVGTSVATFAETQDYPSYISGTTDRKISGATRTPEKVKIESSYVSYSIYDSDNQEIRKAKTIYVNPYLLEPEKAQAETYHTNGSNATIVAYFPTNNTLSQAQRVQLVNQTLQADGYTYRAVS